MNVDIWSQTLLNAMSSFWSKIMGFAPNLLMTILIVIIGLYLAKLISSSFGKLIKRIGFNNLCDRVGLSNALKSVGFEIEAHQAVANLIYVFFALLILITGAETLGLDRVTSLLNEFILYLPKIFGALIIAIIGLFVADRLKRNTEVAVKNLGMDYAQSLSKAVQVLVLITTFSLAISQLEIEIEFLNIAIYILLASVGVAIAISLGFGTRSLTTNLISGIYNRDLLNPGDEITFDGFSGHIVEVSVINTIIENSEGERLAIPNTKLTNSTFKYKPWSD
jgi:small-conductance mechanosensitive channel